MAFVAKQISYYAILDKFIYYNRVYAKKTNEAPLMPLLDVFTNHLLVKSHSKGGVEDVLRKPCIKNISTKNISKG